MWQTLLEHLRWMFMGPAPEPAPEETTELRVVDDQLDRLLAAHDKVRSDARRPKLSLDLRLQLAAESRAERLAVLRPGRGLRHAIDTRSPLAAARSRGFDGRAVGENLFWGDLSPEQVVDRWMASRRHRANLVAARWTLVGLAKEDDYWVVIYGAAADSEDGPAEVLPGGLTAKD